MEPESHVRRLEYGCQLDANGRSQWASRYCDVRSLEYDQRLDLRGYRGQWDHLYFSRDESLYRHG